MTWSRPGTGPGPGPGPPGAWACRHGAGGGAGARSSGISPDDFGGGIRRRDFGGGIWPRLPGGGIWPRLPGGGISGGGGIRLQLLAVGSVVSSLSSLGEGAFIFGEERSSWLGAFGAWLRGAGKYASSSLRSGRRELLGAGNAGGGICRGLSRRNLFQRGARVRVVRTRRGSA